MRPVSPDDRKEMKSTDAGSLGRRAGTQASRPDGEKGGEEERKQQRDQKDRG